MVDIKISRGLNIPIEGAPKQYDGLGVEVKSLARPELISLDLKPFEDVKFKLLAKSGDVVKIGQPLAEDKSFEGRVFVSPAAGVVKEVRRGLKRRLLDIVIEVASEENHQQFGELDPEKASIQEIIERLLQGGIFSRIRSRPFNLLADPSKTPRSIFVKAVESAPFVPAAELQVEGHEKDFQLGLRILAKLTPGKVHLVYRKDSKLKAFKEAEHVARHTVEGPHPIGTHSLHIQRIDPIRSPTDNVWTLNAADVVAIGYLFSRGRYLVDRVISIAGPGVLPKHVGYFKGREGYPVRALIAGRLSEGLLRLVSGDPLMGKKVDIEDFLGFSHTAFTVIPENTEREFLHFFRLGKDKYSMSRAYASGHRDNGERTYYFTTNQHGEHRPFIDTSLYDKVQALDVPTMLLTKAVMAEDFELAQTLGLLEVDSEDFALPTFVCQSKMEMTEIIKQGLSKYAKEILQ